MFFLEVGPDFFSLEVGLFRPEDVVVVSIASINASIRSKSGIFKSQTVRIILIVSISFLFNKLDFIGFFGDFDTSSLMDRDDFRGDKKNVLVF